MPIDVEAATLDVVASALVLIGSDLIWCLELFTRFSSKPSVEQIL